MTHLILSLFESRFLKSFPSHCSISLSEHQILSNLFTNLSSRFKHKFLFKTRVFILKGQSLAYLSHWIATISLILNKIHSKMALNLVFIIWSKIIPQKKNFIKRSGFEREFWIKEEVLNTGAYKKYFLMKKLYIFQQINKKRGYLHTNKSLLTF